jgi:hypothetical protein
LNEYVFINYYTIEILACQAKNANKKRGPVIREKSRGFWGCSKTRLVLEQPFLKIFFPDIEAPRISAPYIPYEEHRGMDPGLPISDTGGKIWIMPAERGR